ncbi:unnamed protein product [Rotaria magnacalcarata]|uniref:Integrase zinc-binding domain-containing protein n=1 Tax=Rotaria magnacalcarata TaxID=392030 RepID=A0A816T5K2_9BILA|nr:unnamed protein product [Rotaria magnacalcarata]
MNNDIGNYVKPCIRCNQNNPIRRKPAGHLKPIESPFGVRQLLSMDFHGPIIPTSRRDDKSTWNASERTGKGESMNGKAYLIDITYGAVTGLPSGGVGAAGETRVASVVRQGTKEVAQSGAKT